MSTFTKLTYHIVFSTKCRLRLIHALIQERLYEYMGGIIRAQDGVLIEIGGIEDHVHLLISLSSKQSLADMICKLKTNSSKWANESLGLKQAFCWQKGYGAFSVSFSQIEQVRKYIRNQRQHHSTRTFENEYIALLKSHQIAFNSEYLFENES